VVCRASGKNYAPQEVPLGYKAVDQTFYDAIIVDDDPDIRELLRLWLKREGYQVFEAENGKVAELTQLRTPADILICDLLMPVKEGMETISVFRRNFPEVGIVAISGGGNIGPDSYLEVAQQLGAWKIYSKPLDVTVLIEALREWKTVKGTS